MTAAGGTSTDAYDSVSVVREREAKDAAFRGEESPIAEENRSRFTGLRYYPLAPALALKVTLRKLPNPEPFTMAATRGDVRATRRYGTFSFTIDGKECSLTAFTFDDHPNSLFVPFKDETNGTETYEVGRYLDLEMSDRGEYLLDFNRAYNPYCAYNPGYTCPIVPEENVLPVAIRAGEQLPAEAVH